MFFEASIEIKLIQKFFGFWCNFGIDSWENEKPTTLVQHTNNNYQCANLEISNYFQFIL